MTRSRLGGAEAEQRAGGEGEQQRGLQRLPPPVRADGAPVDMAADPLAQRGGQPPVPVMQQLVKRGAVLASRAADEEHRDRGLELVARSREERVGVISRDPEHQATSGTSRPCQSWLITSCSPALSPATAARIRARDSARSASPPTSTLSSGCSGRSSSVGASFLDLSRCRHSFRATANSQARRHSGSRSLASFEAAMTNVSCTASAALPAAAAVTGNSRTAGQSTGRTLRRAPPDHPPRSMRQLRCRACAHRSGWALCVLQLQVTL